MKKTIKYVTLLLAAAAIGGIGLAPVAIADPGTTQNVANPTASPSHAPAPAPPSFETGVDPLVPANTGADPFVLVPPGYALSF